MARNVRGERPRPNTRMQWAFSCQVYARTIALHSSCSLLRTSTLSRVHVDSAIFEGASSRTKDQASYACARVHIHLRESAHGQTCRNNTVPEVANGWPARLFEMEVSNSRVKWPLYWSWWSSYGHKLSPVWFNCYRKPTQQQRCITTTRKKI
jgi:hypothetical protein